MLSCPFPVPFLSEIVLHQSNLFAMCSDIRKTTKDRCSRRLSEQTLRIYFKVLLYWWFGLMLSHFYMLTLDSRSLCGAPYSWKLFRPFTKIACVAGERHLTVGSHYSYGQVPNRSQEETLSQVWGKT